MIPNDVKIMVPSRGTVTIKDDQDSGVGLSSYFAISLPFRNLMKLTSLKFMMPVVDLGGQEVAAALNSWLSKETMPLTLMDKCVLFAE